MPHVIPNSNKDKHIADMNCPCEPEIHFFNNVPTVIHKNEDDQITVVIEPDKFYDKRRTKTNEDY